MHLDFITRGTDAKSFMEDLAHQRMTYMHNHTKDGHMEQGLIPVRVCPIQLWDISFPAEHLDKMITTLIGDGKGDGKGQPITHSYKMATAMAGLRRLMGLSKIPNTWNTELALPPVLKHSEILIIGMKPDEFNEKGVEQI